MFGYNNYEFPQQKVPSSVKEKAEWYANCCDWVISKAISCRNRDDIVKKYNVLHKNIPDEFYKKILNPYNATNEKYKRFPATMRNYDLLTGIIRRYVSEYNRNPHDFIVGANNPEVVLGRDAKLREEVSILVQNAIAAEIQRTYAEYINQGGNPQEFNPQEQINIEEFVKEFNENYIDDISAQGADILNVIRDITEDTLFYSKLYFDFVSFGECYTYADVVGTNLIKRSITPLDAYPIPNDSMFVEDFDMFAERRKLTVQQVLDEFDDYLSEKDKEFIRHYYTKGTNAFAYPLEFGSYMNYCPDICEKFYPEERELFRKQPVMVRDYNDGLVDVWHVVWRGQARKAVVTYINEAGFITQRVESDDYKLNPSTGDISIEYLYEPQVYESVRIGTRFDSIYPYKARAIAYDRNGKLPYNGLMELLPGFGQFSLIELITPYQVFYNIVAYHREMALAKNKLSTLLIAKSLLGQNSEETIYRMIADGVLYIDDENDQGMLRAQQVRVIQSDISAYIQQLTTLLADIENSAKMVADMTPQRYGEIATSAGKATTQEAIARGSMGTVIIEYILDCLRERDYARDMDYSKLAWIDGLDTSFRDENNKIRYISLNVNNHIYADYVIKAKNSVIEQEKLRALKELAFNASQNGDIKMALAAIEGDNIAQVSKLISRFQEQKDAHEMQLKQMDEEIENLKHQHELEKIAAQGEEDRKTKELEGYIKEQIALIQADANMISYDNGVDEESKQAGMERLEEKRSQVAREKNQLDREKAMIDLYNKEQDRKVKLEDIKSRVEIAKTNKNRYDKKPSK